MIRWRVLGAVLLATSLLVLANAPVGANAPIRFPAGSLAGTDMDCGFPIDVTVLSGKQVVTVFFDKNGVATQLLFTGVLKVRLTNPSGTYLDLNISGPGTTDLSTGIGVGRGPEVVGVPGHLWYFDGRVVLSFNPDGSLGSIVSHTGFAEDLCPVLAPG
jgi:hypothetical protein